jgi:hypothetical protein
MPYEQSAVTMAQNPESLILKPFAMTWVLNTSFRVCIVTKPPKIILYYRLSQPTWPLSNNKELFCRFRRVKPVKSLTTGSRYGLRPHEGGTRVQHYIKVYKVTKLQTRFLYIEVNVIQRLNSGNKTSRRYTWEAIHRVSLIVNLLPLKFPTIWNRTKPDVVT